MAPIMQHTTYKRIDSIQFFALALLIAILIGSRIAVVQVDSFSMLPTMRHGTVAIAFMDIDSISRGDIVVFFPNTIRSGVPQPIGRILDAHTSEQSYIKRCMGLPGDTLAVQNGKLYINGVAQNEPYLLEACIGYEMQQITLGEDEFFLLGDNRNDSMDSHTIGAVSQKQLIGRILFYTPAIADIGDIIIDALHLS